jgi:hypothetical protein
LDEGNVEGEDAAGGDSALPPAQRQPLKKQHTVWRNPEEDDQYLFPSGTYEKDSVLGVAVDASTVAIFKDSVADAEGFLGRPSAEEVERSVSVHELGHLLGLVNLVYTSPRDHEDSENKGHSNNDGSVMYWAIESSDVGNFISGDLPDEFDEDDKADLNGLADGSISAKDQIWS